MIRRATGCSGRISAAQENWGLTIKIRTLIALSSALLLIVAAYIAVAWFNNKDIELSAAPERQSSAAAIPAQDSNLILRLRIPLKTISEAVNTSLPKDFHGEGNGEDSCGKVLFTKVCVGTHYEYTVTRTSNFAVSTQKNRLRVGVGLKVEGKGGFRGDGAKLLGLDAKNFRAAADVYGSFGLKIKPDWCPELPMSISYKWTDSPKVEIVSHVWIGVEGVINDKVNDALNSLPDKVRSVIRCDEIQKAVRQAWKVYAIPVELPNSPPLTLIIEPKSLGTSGLVTTPEDVRLDHMSA